MINVRFWEMPLSMWDEMHTVGLRSHYVASVFATPLLIAHGNGLIANISSFAGAGHLFNTPYGVGKAAVDRLAADMAHELRPYGVAAVSLWPGIVKTERIMAQAGTLPFDVNQGESPQFTGRAIVALATDPNVLDRSGRVLVVAELAEEYGFTDIDGSRPASLRRR
jgi:dehydrogenase/reductase SDR family protein 1